MSGFYYILGSEMHRADILVKQCSRGNKKGAQIAVYRISLVRLCAKSFKNPKELFSVKKVCVCSFFFAERKFI